MQATGRVKISVNGKTLRSKKGATITFGGYTRTPIVVDSGEVLYSEEKGHAEVECTVTHTFDTDVTEMADFANATLTFETDTGRVYMIKNAFTMESPKLTGGEGDLTLHMAGSRAEDTTG